MLFTIIQAPRTVENGEVVEDTKNMELRVSGDTYPIKEQLKEMNLNYDSFTKEWYILLDNQTFCDTIFPTIKRLVIEFGSTLDTAGTLGKAIVPQIKK